MADLPLHNKNNFLFPVSVTDVKVFTKDVNHINTNTISPKEVSLLSVSGTNIVVGIKNSGEPVYIRFFTNSEALQAMIYLKKALDEVSYNIDNTIGMASFYQHTQITASNIWSFTHNLNRRTSVSIVDNNFIEIEGLVTYPSVNMTVIYFNSNISGHAWI